jgi:hypothetical protein
MGWFAPALTCGYDQGESPFIHANTIGWCSLSLSLHELVVVVKGEAFFIHANPMVGVISLSFSLSWLFFELVNSYKSMQLFMLSMEIVVLFWNLHVV